MDVISDIETHLRQGAGSLGPHAVTIGVYDGVHVGHQSVINTTSELGARLNAKTAVVTFDPHPAVVLQPDRAPKLLTSREQKLGLLEALGVDTVVVVPFDKERSSESAEQFVKTVLVDCLDAKAVAVGEDFHFGKGRLGNVEVLAEMGKSLGFECHPQKLVGAQGASASDGSVSSTAIRRALSEGDLQTANRFLGRHYGLQGVVSTGDKRGRTIGFPTANVLVDGGRALPSDGVYAGWYIDHGPTGAKSPSEPGEQAEPKPCAINVGRRPTFYDAAGDGKTTPPLLVEAHILDFDGDLYGRQATVEFVARLRDERRFDGVDELAKQLGLDIEQARRVLSGETPT